MSYIWTLRAFLKRDLAIDVSYRLSFALEAFHVLTAVAAFYFFSRLVGEARTESYASFPFILVGLAVNAYMITCFVCFAQGIRGGQPSGTLKAILATPISSSLFLVGSSLYPFLRSSADAGAYVLAGVLFGVPLGHAHAVSVGLVLALSLLAFSSIGILSAAFTLVFRRGDPLLWLFGSSSWLLGGVLYPVGVLPRWLQRVATLLPMTHAAAGMRAALLAGAPPSAIASNLGALALFAGVGFPLSVLVFNLSLDHAKRVGSLDHR
jgi:ABC-2 type transport system permease protein